MVKKSQSEDIFETIQSDPFVDWFGIDHLSLEAGYAEMELTLEDRHTNFHGTPHGGVVYSLADSAFGAAGSVGGVTGVAPDTNISYLSAVEPGTTLVSVTERTHRSDTPTTSGGNPGPNITLSSLKSQWTSARSHRPVSILRTAFLKAVVAVEARPLECHVDGSARRRDVVLVGVGHATRRFRRRIGRRSGLL
jgi:acyl-CoA thioesterase